MIYRFKICFEEHEEIYREIEIKSTQNFADLHNAIQNAVNFDNSHPASFYISDDHWRKGVEITNKKKQSTDDPIKTMDKSKLAAFIEDPHQKFVYVFDFSMMWTFYVELIKILPEDVKVSYPKCIKSVGASRAQYKTALIPPPLIDDDEEEVITTQPEKIFNTEEGYDQVEEEEDVLVDGEEEEEEEGESGITSEFQDLSEE